MIRRLSIFDHLLTQVNDALTTLVSETLHARENPAENIPEANLSVAEKQKSANLMRINHTGEVCAQALYRGQLAISRDEKTRAMLQHSCAEETDHLAWTKQRVLELHSHTSYLNLFFYGNAFAMGVMAGLWGDRWSLGFVEETEIQVAKHLQNHLEKLPTHDVKSRAIISKMRDEEIQHEAAAVHAGAVELPFMIKKLMGWHAHVMTTVAYWM